MDFVGNHDNAVFGAEPADFRKFFPGPDSACRIVGIAEKHHGALRVGKILFQPFEIDEIAAVTVIER